MGVGFSVNSVQLGSWFILQVLLQAQKELTNYNGIGISVLGEWRAVWFANVGCICVFLQKLTPIALSVRNEPQVCRFHQDHQHHREPVEGTHVSGGPWTVSFSSSHCSNMVKFGSRLPHSHWTSLSSLLCCQEDSRQLQSAFFARGWVWPVQCCTS